MDAKKLGILGAAVAVVGIGALLLLRDPPATPEPAPVSPAPAAVPGPADPDVRGLPPMFPEGRQHEPAEVSFDQFFEYYGAGQILDPATGKLREDVAADLQESLRGKEVTWDGYVGRIEDAPSGRVMIVLTLQERPTPEAAMVKFSAAWSEHVHGYQKGDRVRVVGVYDKMLGAFPSLRGLSIEPLPAEG